MTVPLPDKGDGTRRRQRAERQRRSRRLGRRAALALPVLVVVAGLAYVGFGIYFAATDDESGSGESPAEVIDPLEADLADAPPDLVVLSDADGAVYGVTILAPASAAIVHVPPGTLVEVPSLGLASLADADRQGGDDVLQHSLENVLGIRFGAVVHLDPAALAAELERTGPLTVHLGEAVEDRDANGQVTVVFPAGDVDVDAENVVAFLSETGAQSALQRLVRHQGFWTALVADGDSSIDGAAAMAGRDVRQRVLPVQAVSGVDGDDEQYRVVDDDLPALVALAFPGSASPGAARIRVRILNGAGTPGIAQQVQPLLVDAGAEVTLSGNADRFDYPTTQVVYYDDASAGAARAVQEALGVGELVKSLTDLAVVDVTVVVGADFLAAHPGG
jgi:hypothetical protein